MPFIVVRQYENKPDTYEVVGVPQPLGALVKKEIVNHSGEQENEIILTIKVAGYMCRFPAISPDYRRYMPAQYQVFRVLWTVRKPPNTIEMDVIKLTSFPV